MVFYFISRETTPGPQKGCQRHGFRFLGDYDDDPHPVTHSPTTKTVYVSQTAKPGKCLWWGSFLVKDTTERVTAVALAGANPSLFKMCVRDTQDPSKGIVLGEPTPDAPAGVLLGHWKSFAGEQVVRTHQKYEKILDFILIRSDCEPKQQKPLLLPKCIIRRLMKSIHPYEGVTLINAHAMNVLHLDQSHASAPGILAKLGDNSKNAWMLSKDEALCIDSGMEDLHVTPPIAYLMIYNTPDRVLAGNDYGDIAEMICIDAIFPQDILPEDDVNVRSKGKQRAT